MSTITTINSGDSLEPTSRTTINTNFSNLNTDKAEKSGQAFTGPVSFTSYYGAVTSYSPTAAGTATLTCQLSNIHAITMPAGNITIAVSNTSASQALVIDIIQDSGGSRTVTWFSGIKWAGGSPPVLTTTANKIDTIGIRVVTAGSAYYGYVVGQNI